MIIKRASKRILRLRRMALVDHHAFRCYDEIRRAIISEEYGHWGRIIANHMEALLKEAEKLKQP